MLSFTWEVKGSQSKYLEYITKPTHPQRKMIPHTNAMLIHIDLHPKENETRHQYLSMFTAPVSTHFTSVHCGVKAWRVNVVRQSDLLHTNSTNKISHRWQATKPVSSHIPLFWINYGHIFFECITVCGVVGSVSMLKIKMENMRKNIIIWITRNILEITHTWRVLCGKSYNYAPKQFPDRQRPTPLWLVAL